MNDRNKIDHGVVSPPLPAQGDPITPLPWRVAVGALEVSTLGLAAAAVWILRLYCEGFGCVGVGAAWVAWTTAYAVVLVISIVVRGRMPRPSLWSLVATGTLGTLLVMGGGLAVAWLVSR